MRLGERDQPRVEGLAALAQARRVAQSLERERLHGGQRVLDPVIELVDQQFAVTLLPLAFGNVDGGTNRALELPRRIDDRRGLENRRQRRPVVEPDLQFLGRDLFAPRGALERQFGRREFVAVAKNATSRTLVRRPGQRHVRIGRDVQEPRPIGVPEARFASRSWVNHTAVGTVLTTASEARGLLALDLLGVFADPRELQVASERASNSRAENGLFT